MKKVFLCTSFSGKVDAETGRVLPEHRAFVEQILAGLRKDDMMEVFCAIEHEGWMLANDVPPEVGVRADLETVDHAEVVVALMESQPSAGVQFELGYAAAQGKQVIIAHQAAEKLAYFNHGAVGAGLLTELGYEDAEGLIAQLVVAVNAPADEVQT